MMDISKYFDSYEIKARLYPALLVILPLTVSISIKFPELYTNMTGFIALFSALGGLHLFAQLGRDAGKKLEQSLYLKWGGIPSVAIFRYRDTTLPNPEKYVLHKKMSLLTNTTCPTPQSESNAPELTDEIYHTWSNFLRNKSRDTEEFKLLFKENINFGFRRNVLGLKPAYTISGIVSLLIIGFPFEASNQILLGVAVSIALYTLIFVLVVNEAWVKVPGIEYAKRLIELEI